MISFPPIDNTSQERLVLEKPERFSSQLWAKISQISKKCLLKNHFVYPIGLEGNYSYFDTKSETLILDRDSHLGHARISDVCFGQNITTGEFLAFKPIDYETKVIDQDHQEVVAMRNLGRLRGVVCHEEKEIVYMAVELIDGITLSDYFWNEYFSDLAPAFRLAISYIKERKFLIESKVVQSDVSCNNIMVDVMKKKVYIVDFGGHSVFNRQTKSFIPWEYDSYINSIDIVALRQCFPYPEKVSVSDPLKGSLKTFQDQLEKIKENPLENVYHTTLDDVLQLLEEHVNS